MIRPAVLLLLTLTTLTLASPTQSTSNTESPSATSFHFDPHRNAADDIRTAITDAKRSHRRILVDVGGDWCPYCLQMDAFFNANKDLLTFRDEHYVVVPVYFDSKDKTPKALAAYPHIEGIPHFYILDVDGHVLHSQHVVELREAGDYSPAKMRSFLQQWAAESTSQNRNR